MVRPKTKDRRLKTKDQRPKGDLAVKIGKMYIKNPVIAASGTVGCEALELMEPSKLGAIITKTITLKPRIGNRPPRIAETASGMLNSIGLENEGLEGLKTKWLPCLENFDTKIIVSITGENEKEIVELVNRLKDIKEIDAIELNLSCPNIKTGLQFSQDKKTTYKMVKRIRHLTNLTLVTKLTPNVTDIREIAIASEKAGSDAVSLVNTYIGMAVDMATRRPLLGNVTGGLSGPAIKPLAIKAVWDVYNTVDIPIIGGGGITGFRDAVEFIICGAAAVSIGTANFVNLKTCVEIIDGIRYYMKQQKIGNVNDLRGSLKLESVEKNLSL